MFKSNKSLFLTSLMAISSYGFSVAMAPQIQLPTDPEAERIIAAFKDAAHDSEVVRLYKESMDASKRVFIALCDKASLKMNASEQKRFASLMGAMIELMDFAVIKRLAGNDGLSEQQCQEKMMAIAQRFGAELMPLLGAMVVLLQDEKTQLELVDLMRSSVDCYRDARTRFVK